jgi:hypothetical protein
MVDKDETKARAAKARAEALSPERRSEIASEAAKARWSEGGPDVRTPDHFVIYQNPKGVKVDLRYAGQTMWATQRQMAEMFDVSIGTISRHLKRIFAESELQENSVVALNAITAADGGSGAPSSCGSQAVGGGRTELRDEFIARRMAEPRRPAVYAPFPGSPLFTARSTMLISARRSRRQSSRLMFCSTIV